MPFILGRASLANLEGVHPSLVRVVKRAITLTSVDFKVIEGVRSVERAFENFGKGRTAAECRAAGCPGEFAQPDLAKVTWVSRPLNTKHIVQPDGYGHAVDLLPAPYDWKIDRVTKEPFLSMSKAMLTAASYERVPVRWGADWDADGRPFERGESDSPHFELAPVRHT